MRERAREVNRSEEQTPDSAMMVNSAEHSDNRTCMRLLNVSPATARKSRASVPDAAPLEKHDFSNLRCISNACVSLCQCITKNKFPKEVGEFHGLLSTIRRETEKVSTREPRVVL